MGGGGTLVLACWLPFRFLVQRNTRLPPSSSSFILQDHHLSCLVSLHFSCIGQKPQSYPIPIAPEYQLHSFSPGFLPPPLAVCHKTTHFTYGTVSVGVTNHHGEARHLTLDCSHCALHAQWSFRCS